MNTITDTVRDKYAEAARHVAGGSAATCGCGTGTATGCDPITSNLYDEQQAGFEAIEIETTRVYDVEDARAYLAESGLDADAIAPQVNGRVTSAFVRARKPAAKAACCGPTCCS